MALIDVGWVNRWSKPNILNDTSAKLIKTSVIVLLWETEGQLPRILCMTVWNIQNQSLDPLGNSCLRTWKQKQQTSKVRPVCHYGLKCLHYNWNTMLIAWTRCRTAFWICTVKYSWCKSLGWTVCVVELLIFKSFCIQLWAEWIHVHYCLKLQGQIFVLMFLKDWNIQFYSKITILY